jgi:hypothetical protein
MNTALILVDYDNATKINSFGRKLNQGDIDSINDLLLENIIKIFEKIDLPIDELEVRFYSGWHSLFDSRLTDLFKMVSVSLRKVPKRWKRFRVRIQQVQKLAVFPEVPIEGTLRRRPGVPHFKMNASLDCDISDCPIKLIAKWKRKECFHSACEKMFCDIFYYEEQKLVDSHIFSDLIFFSTQNIYNCISIYSADDDMVPAAIHAKTISMFCEINIIRNRRLSHYDSLLQGSGINIYTVGG